MRRAIICLLLVWTSMACSSSDPAAPSGSAERKPAGTPHDPVDVCEKVADVCRLDGSRLGVCIEPPAGTSPSACAGRSPCYLCMSQH